MARKPSNWTRQQCRCPAIYDTQSQNGDTENRSKSIILREMCYSTLISFYKHQVYKHIQAEILDFLNTL